MEMPRPIRYLPGLQIERPCTSESGTICKFKVSGIQVCHRPAEPTGDAGPRDGKPTTGQFLAAEIEFRRRLAGRHGPHPDLSFQLPSERKPLKLCQIERDAQRRCFGRQPA